MGKTSIEWARNRDGSGGSTWNPIRARNRKTGQVGTWCQKISPGCANCYAHTHNRRELPHGCSNLPYTAQGGELAEIFIDQKMLAEPLRHKKPETYFVCSMTDLFMERVSDAQITAVLAVAALTPQHTYQILTKRPERARSFLSGEGRCESVVAAAFAGAGVDAARGSRLSLAIGDGLSRRMEMERRGIAGWPLPNIWLGVSVENQEAADKRIPALLATDAYVRFLSVEPLLGPVNLEGMLADHEWEHGTPGGINWVIVGGESGRGARPTHPEWVRSLRDQCNAAGVPFFFKQWGAWEPRTRNDGRPFDSLALHNRDRLVDLAGSVHCTQEPAGVGYACMSLVGKAAAGRLLDGREWSEMPEVTHG